jgi:hypothetical protein
MTYEVLLLFGELDWLVVGKLSICYWASLFDTTKQASKQGVKHMYTYERCHCTSDRMQTLSMIAYFSSRPNSVST